MVHPYYGTLQSNKMEWNVPKGTCNLSEPPGNDAGWKEPNPNGHMLYGSICVTVLKWQNDRYREQIHVREQGHGGEDGGWKGSRCGY